MNLTSIVCIKKIKYFFWIFIVFSFIEQNLNFYLLIFLFLFRLFTSLLSKQSKILFSFINPSLFYFDREKHNNNNKNKYENKLFEL